MRYEVGDRIKIKSSQVLNELPGIISSGGNIQIPNSCHFTSTMDIYCQTILTIRKIIERKPNLWVCYYMYDEKNSQYVRWCFSDQMFTLHERHTKLKQENMKFNEELL